VLVHVEVQGSQEAFFEERMFLYLDQKADELVASDNPFATVVLVVQKEIDRLTNRQQTMGLEEFLLNRAVQTGLKKGFDQGIEQERQERSRAFVTNLIQQTNFADVSTARFADVSVEFVQQIRAELATQ
jgi:hypothetical protein